MEIIKDVYLLFNTAFIPVQSFQELKAREYPLSIGFISLSIALLLAALFSPSAYFTFWSGVLFSSIRYLISFLLQFVILLIVSRIVLQRKEIGRELFCIQGLSLFPLIISSLLSVFIESYGYFLVLFFRVYAYLLIGTAIYHCFNSTKSKAAIIVICTLIVRSVIKYISL